MEMGKDETWEQEVNSGQACDRHREKSFCLILNVMTFHIASRMQALSDS